MMLCLFLVIELSTISHSKVALTCSDILCCHITEWKNPLFSVYQYLIVKKLAVIGIFSCRVHDSVSDFPSAKIFALGDFNVHNVGWFPYSTHTDCEGREAEFIFLPYLVA